MRDFKADMRLCEAATPGPWRAGSWSIPTSDQFTVRQDEDIYEDDMKEVATAWQGQRYPDTPKISSEEAKANALFIAEAREGWPAALKEIERLREEARIKDGLLSKAAEDLQEYESEYKRLCEENEQLREKNKRMKDGIQHILDFYPIERADYIPIDILFEIHMKLKAIVKEHDPKC